jgi:serine protease AprX
MRGQGHPNETRSSALWGRGSKSDRKRITTRAVAVVAVLTTAAFVGAGTATAAPSGFGRPSPGAFSRTTTPTIGTPSITPSAFAPGRGYGTPGSYTGNPNPSQAGANLGKGPSPWTSTHLYPLGSLLARAQANPRQNFKVIVQTHDSSLQNGVGRWAGGYGRMRHSLNLIDGVGITLPGWAILYIAENPQYFGNVTITEDVPVAFTGQVGPDDWQASIGADQLWSTPDYTAPQAPAIAIVDSGIDPSKAADFGSRVVAHANFASDSASGDPLGHGTMVAGVAAGAANPASGGGVAQNAPLVDLRVANSQGEAQTSDVVAALDWVLQNKDTYDIRVVNLSLVGDQQTSFAFDPMDKAVERLWLNGIVVVAASGNNGTDDPTQNLGAPGNDPFIITAGAVDTNGTVDQSDDYKAPWSAFGYTPDGFLKPEISAPGRYIVAPIPDGSGILQAEPGRVVAPGYLWMSGTSFSSPAVAGAAAQLLALHPSWTPDQVKGALMMGATALSQSGTGIGELNLPAANAIADPTNPNAALEAFVGTDPSTGLQVFDESAWANAASTSTNWVATNWVATNWVATNWVATNWVATNWVATNWVATNWVATNWVATNWVQ